MVLVEIVKGFFGFNAKNKEDLLSQDFKKRGLYGSIPKYYYGGRKLSDNFYTEKGGSLAVSIEYEDIIEDGLITDIKKTAKAYNVDGSVYAEKVELEPVKNRVKLALSRVKNAFVHLQITAAEHENPQVRYVTATLLEYFNTEIGIWLNGNPQPFLNAMVNEPPTIDVDGEAQPNQIYYLLNAPLDDTGKVVLDGITEQVTGVKWESSN